MIALLFTCYIAHIGDGRYETQKALTGLFLCLKFVPNLQAKLNENYFQKGVDSIANLIDN
ncbi:hypothetical protein NCCP2140_28620 [Pseudoalteromonas sp. NCCP-2140]|nr:hypothetical protein NCCP2140_28620 [Pseudoalteromonas sp. NCCP-2140]